MNSFKRLGEKKLPDEKCLYSSLKDGTTDDNGNKLDSHISDKYYLTCKKSWNEVNIKNVGNYNDRYLEKDVLLLAEGFERFIDTCLKFYVIGPCIYVCSPEFSWDEMFKMTGVRLEKFVDIDMYLFNEKGLTRGISYVAKRYPKANNKYMNDYVPAKPSKYISYLNMNNLYSWPMSGYG